jgi:hypothetical protein
MASAYRECRTLVLCVEGDDLAQDASASLNSIYYAEQGSAGLHLSAGLAVSRHVPSSVSLP